MQAAFGNSGQNPRKGNSSCPPTNTPYTTAPLTVLCRLALPMAVCAALAVALLSEPPDSIPFAIIISGIIFLLAFFLLFIRAPLDRRPQITLSPKGLFIHTKFSENILDSTYRPRKRKEAFYAWRNLGGPTLAPPFLYAYPTGRQPARIDRSPAAAARQRHRRTGGSLLDRNRPLCRCA